MDHQRPVKREEMGSCSRGSWRKDEDSATRGEIKHNKSQDEKKVSSSEKGRQTRREKKLHQTIIRKINNWGIPPIRVHRIDGVT